MSAKQHFKTAERALGRLEQLAAEPIAYYPGFGDDEPKAVPPYGAPTLVGQIHTNLEAFNKISPDKKTIADLWPGISEAQMKDALDTAEKFDLSKLKALPVRQP